MYRLTEGASQHRWVVKRTPWTDLWLKTFSVQKLPEAYLGYEYSLVIETPCTKDEILMKIVEIEDGKEILQR